MIITTWNVNGIRAALQKGLLEWIRLRDPDVVCLQEIKARPEQIDLSGFYQLGYEIQLNSAQQPGYSGVALLYKKAPLEIKFGLGEDQFDIEGRVIHLSYPEYELFNIYFPNGGRGEERVAFKLEFYKKLLSNCKTLMENGKEIIITGDFNTAHKEIDLKNPKENQQTSGFLPEEREWIDKYLDEGFIDIYRSLYPDRIQYTWWTYRFRARERNIGWRLDYYLITEGLKEFVEDAIIHEDVTGSDHCPVDLILKIPINKGKP